MRRQSDGVDDATPQAWRPSGPGRHACGVASSTPSDCRRIKRNGRLRRSRHGRRHSCREGIKESSYALRGRVYMPASDTWGQTRSGWSGQGQEELLHLLDTEGGWGAGGIPGDALPHRAGDQLEPGPVEGPRHRGQLGDHIVAVPAGLDHADDATDLALGAAQPLENLLGLGLILQLHVTLPVRRTRPPYTVPPGVWEHRGFRST